MRPDDHSPELRDIQDLLTSLLDTPLTAFHRLWQPPHSMELWPSPYVIGRGNHPASMTASAGERIL
jgi:hypothetical protein